MHAAFDGVVFAGGGTRCFWQLGFWFVIQPALSLRPTAVSAVSAGAAMACAALLDRCSETLELFQRASSRNLRNVHWHNLWRDEPLFPHYGIYRQALLEAFDQQALERLKQAADLLVLIARPPGKLPPTLALTLGLGSYLASRLLDGTPHPRLAAHLGFTPEVFSARDCPSPEALADLVLASSCTPPFTPPLRHGGRPALDGGLLDSAPASPLARRCERVLVLLTRRYPTIPQHPGRLYLQPSAPIPISKWDYTSPQLLQRTYDIGRRDGEQFLAERRASARRAEVHWSSNVQAEVPSS